MFTLIAHFSLLHLQNDYVQSDQQAFHYIEQAVDQVCGMLLTLIIYFLMHHLAGLFCFHLNP
jgi:hypothetical protein